MRLVLYFQQAPLSQTPLKGIIGFVPHAIVVGSLNFDLDK